jgi:PAS domain S-box-containing protein
MDWLFPAVLSTMVATLLLCAAYGYLYVVYRERHLGFWATAWGIYVVRYVALLYAIARGQTPLVYFINMSAIIAALFFLYRGTTEFIGERSTRPWLVAFGAVEVWTGIAIFGGLSFYHLTIPLFGFMAWVLCWVGLRFLRSDLRPSIGKRITGVTFILWGLHQADYPLLRPIEWFAPFGYMIGTTCAVTIALGTLLVYFEEVRSGLVESRRRVNLLFQKAPDPIILHGEDGLILDANEQAAAKLGYSGAELKGLCMTQIVPDIVTDSGVSRWSDIPLGETRVVETLFRNHSGDLFPVEVHTTAINWGSTRFYLGFARDITGRKRAERSLRESEDKYRTLFSESPYGIGLADPDSGIIVECNQALCDLVGRSREELIGQPQTLLHPPDEQEGELTRSFRQHVNGKEAELLPARFVTKAGEFRDVEIKTRRVWIQERPLVLGFFQDVTERKRAEQERDRLFAYSVDMLCVAGPDGRFLDLSPAWSKVLGWDLDQLKRMRRIDLIHPDDRERTMQAGRALAEGTPALAFENRYRCKDGTYRWLEWNIFPVPEKGLQFGVARDVTDAKREAARSAELEEQLRQSQKMEAIGTLAGGIAHDFNNILTPLMAHAEMALTGLPGDSPLRDDMEQILRSAERAADLVRHFLAISRKGEKGATAVDLASMLAEVAEFLRASLPTTIDIDQHMAPDCPPVAASPTQVHQILLNLCTNAKDAMEEDGGSLTLSVEPATDGGHVRLTVRDTGVGIPPAEMDRIFEPYYTTKSLGKGSGLGLAVVHGIVTSLGGRIDVRSRPGEGTTFELLLPVAPEGLPPDKEPVRIRYRGRGEHILVVDDDAAIVAIATRHLENLGYRVTAFTSSPEALEAFRSAPSTFDLILTDHTMPRLTGLALAREVHAVRPELPVVLTTGFTEGLDEATPDKDGVYALLAKPYNVSELSASLSRALRDARTGST